MPSETLSAILNIKEITYPFVTVGVCVKNCQQTIEKCIASLLKSSYEKERMEIILVDNRSTDNTVSIATKLLENGGIKFRILDNGRIGLGYSRQLVLENAEGEYICWVDGDGFVTPRFIENQVNFIRTQPSLGIVEPLMLSSSCKFVARLEMYNWVIPSLNAVRKGKTPRLGILGAITPVKVLKDVGGFNVNLRGSYEDIDLIEKMWSRRYKVAMNPRAVIYHANRESWQDVSKQMRWYGQTSPRRQTTRAFQKMLDSFVTRTPALLGFAKYTDDPAAIFSLLYSIFQHTTCFIYYLLSEDNM